MMLQRFLLLTLLCWPLLGKKPAPLPGFSLLTPDGKTLSSSQLKLPKNWLLVYVHPRSAESVVVLNQLKDDKQAAANQKVIVIVGGASPIEARDLMAGYGHLKAVTWYADPKRDVLQTLDLPGIPAVIGMRD